MASKQNKYDRTHQSRLNAYLRAVEEIYQEAAKEAAAIGLSIDDFNPDRLFSFSDYPSTRKKVDSLLESLKTDLSAVIINGVKSEWTLANRKNNELCRQVFGDKINRLTQAQYRRYFSTNGAAREAFLQRKENGLRLSDRVWNYTNQFKAEIELGLDIGIRGGLSAQKLARQLQDFLKHPDMLFRRVRNEHGQLQLSKRAAAYHPGRGVYRSSYKNARRLAVTECNMAYRTADYERWQQLDFVVGIQIEPSKTNHPIPDICDDLAGKYPKDFKWTGWHPHCRCHALSILKTMDELAADAKRILNGKEPTEGSVNEVTDLPDCFKGWVNDNADRIAFARSNGTLPYFLKDNESKGWFGQFVESRYTNAYLKQMQAHGIDFDDNIADRLKESPFNRIDIVTLNSEIQSILAKHGVTDVLCVMKATSAGNIRLNWASDDFEMVRSFDTDSKGIRTVDHELFTLSKNLQGKGISKQIFRALYKQYKAVGVQRMEVFANIDVGGYTWARYGFCVADRDTALSAIKISRLTQKQEARIVAIIEEHFSKSSAPFPMNKIARLPYGKKALLGPLWDGILDLTDLTQRRTFESYLR